MAVRSFPAKLIVLLYLPAVVGLIALGASAMLMFQSEALSKRQAEIRTAAPEAQNELPAIILKQIEIDRDARRALIAGAAMELAFLSVLLFDFVRQFSSEGKGGGVRGTASGAMNATEEVGFVSRVMQTLAETLPVGNDTDSKEAELALLHNVSEVVCALDQSGRFVNVSPSSKNSWGYPSDELIGRWLVEFVDEPDVPRAVRAMKELAEQKTSLPFECKMRRKDGLMIDVLWSAYWSKEEARLFCIAHEITARKTAESKLKESEARIRLITDNMPVALVVVEPEGTIEQSNPAAHAMFGIGDKEIMHKKLNDILRVADTQTIASMMMFLNKSLGHVCSLEGLRADGRTFPIEVTVTEFEALEGDKRLLLAMLDVSERREMERLKQEFVAVLSHELRTPLTSLQGFLSMLGQGVYGEVADIAAQRTVRAQQNITRLIGLINNLLDLEKLEAGKFDYDFKDTTVTSIVEHSVGSVQEFAEQQGLKVNVSAVSASVRADDERLTQVLVNFLSNAIKFSRAGDEIEVAVKETENGTLEFSVSDHGPGIPKEQTERIFERYHQIRDEHGTQKRGTGLGLPICKAIVEQHGGTIGVASEVGNGSRFWFIIPRTQPDHRHSEQSEETAKT